MKARIEDGVVYSPYPCIDIPVCSFYALAKEVLLLKPEKTALVCGENTVTRAEVLCQMQRYAVGFRRSGIAPGERICIHLNNSIENLLAMYGCILAGATVVLAKTSLSESELRYQANESDSTYVLTDVEHTEKVKRAVASLPIKGLFCMGLATGFVSAADFAELDEKEYQEHPITDPKSTVLAVHVLPFGEEDVFLGQSPIMHQSGMLYGTIIMLAGATKVITPTDLNSIGIMDAVDNFQITAAHFVPTALQALVREMRRANRRLPSIKRIVVTGSVLTISAANEAREAFGGLECLLNMYGMTESCSLVTGQPKSSGNCTGVDAGVPNITTMLKVVDVLTRQKLGPPPELFDEEGYCKSGDAGYYDEDGRLYIVDRLKQLIKCMDIQVVPAELEELLLQEHPADIAEVSVVGLPHSEYGEVAAAAVVLTQEGGKKNLGLLANSIKATVEKQLAVHKHLHGGVFFVDSFPKTDNGKLDRSALKHSLAQARQR
ncbi:hypothetical protein MTO96_020784 [Rhipicephalus appendiculatus]